VPRIVNDTFTCPGDSTPTYSSWGEVGAATSVDAGVTSANNESPDLWIQWTDDPDGPEPEDVDVFATGEDPGSHGQLYYVHAENLTPAGAYVRIKGVAYGTDAGPCHARIDAN
jgi:hypothetical protein